MKPVGYVYVRAPSNAAGWVSSRLLIAAANAERLKGLSPDAYVEAHHAEGRMKARAVRSQLQSLQPLLESARRAMQSDVASTEQWLRRISARELGSGPMDR